MKRDSVNYFYVGLFVLSSLGLLMWVLFRLSVGGGERDLYYTYYHNVAGLSKGTLVTYEGYVLGKVTEIEPARNGQGIRYRVELALRKGWKIPDDSIARIYSDGLLSDTVVNISEGRSGRWLPPGGTLRGEQGVDLFAILGEVAGDVGDLSEHALRPLIESLNRTVQRLGESLEQRVPAVLEGAEHLVGQLDDAATHLAEVLDDEGSHKARRILDNVDRASADLSELAAGLASVKRDAEQLMRKLDVLVSDSAPDVRASVAELRAVLEQVSQYSTGILQNMEDTSRNMNEFSRQIRDNPGRLLRNTAPPEGRAKP
ncbi:MAG TPA: MCE family protein [Gammaproteobacteria bacterium]|nr:MCE family protein [Gammaproteobacteria bacterium]